MPKNRKPKKRNYITMISTDNVEIISKANPNTYNHSKKLKIKYEIKINKKYEINNLSYTNKIHSIDFNNITLNMQSLDSNEICLKNNLLNKYVDENSLFIRKITADGNCFFRSLSYFFTKNEINYDYFRNYPISLNVYI